MKKSTLYLALGYLAAAAACLAVTLLTDTRIEPLLCGMVGGFGVAGLRLLRRYLYWSRPENAAAYAERQRETQISLHDERKIMLREKSGSLMYRATYWAEAVAVVELAVLSALGVGRPAARVAMIALALAMVAQTVAGRLVYRALEKKY